MVRTSNTKNKHNTKDLAIKTSSRQKKLAENQENRLFYGTHIPFKGPEGGWGSCDEKFFFSIVAKFLPPGTCQVWGALEKPFLRY